MSWETELDEIEPIDHEQTPRCAYHPEKEAERKCDECEKNICGLDMMRSGTVELCKDCFKDHAKKPVRGPIYSILLATVPIFLVVLIFVLVRGYF